MLNKGLATHRFAENPEEKRFAEVWDRMNQPENGPGTHTLCYMLSQDDHNRPVSPTKDQRQVAATVIQWLGSPVGKSFLEELGYTKQPK